MKTCYRVFFVACILSAVDICQATEFEKLGDSIAKALGTTKAFKTQAQVGKEAVSVFYAKDAAGKASKFAVIQKGLYEPNCTHTWVIAVNAATSKVEDIRVVEMACPHAFPTRQSSYLEQYKGKGPADSATLKDQIHTVAKATGSCNLTTDAVVVAIKSANMLKGKI